MHICWVRKNNTWTNTYSCFNARYQRFWEEFFRRFQAHNAFKPVNSSLHSFLMHRTSEKTIETVVFIVRMMTTATMMIWLNSSFAFKWNTWKCIQAIRTMGKVKWTSFEHEIHRKHTFHFSAMMSLLLFLLHIYHYPALLEASFSPETETDRKRSLFLFLLLCVGCASSTRKRSASCRNTLNWSALGPTRHAPHRISFDEETMATSPPVHQSASSISTTFAPSTKTTNTQAYHPSQGSTA